MAAAHKTRLRMLVSTPARTRTLPLHRSAPVPGAATFERRVTKMCPAASPRRAVLCPRTGTLRHGLRGGRRDSPVLSCGRVAQPCSRFLNAAAQNSPSAWRGHVANEPSRLARLNWGSAGAPAAPPALGVRRSKAGADAGAPVHGEERRNALAKQGILPGLNKGNEKKLGDWGFEVDDTAAPAKAPIKKLNT